MSATAEAQVTRLARVEAGSEPPLRVTTFGLTDKGQRSSNEDQFAVAHVQRVLRVSQSSLTQPEVLLGEQMGHLLVVADGMGGHQGGEYASALAVVGIENLLLNTISWLSRLKGAAVLDELCRALQITDRWVGEEARRTPQLKGMGTTLTMAFVTDRSLYVAHAGDSRCYRWRDGRLERLTRDHTLVQQLVTEGMINAEEAARHSMRNVVTNAVGGGKVGVDPEVHKHTVRAGDVILLCTDGLSGELTDDEIGAELARGSTPEQTSRKLVDEAKVHEGSDNVTVVIARFDEETAAAARPGHERSE